MRWRAQGECQLTLCLGCNLLNGSCSGDKLSGKYAEAEQSPQNVTVADKAVDLGEIQLSTRSAAGSCSAKQVRFRKMMP
ncbi:MAG: hypothetical protein SH850_18205 [Planctomycetaceae bacterium]|nr:hypothetical protein [Planctomycetaceae bacterium]